jgi:hypothetical protein
MTPEIFNQSKNLFLLFSPGCGGNHLANMLSLHPAFEPRFESNDYEQAMILKYDSITFKGDILHEINSAEYRSPIVHFSELQNLQFSTLNKYRQKIIASERKYIFCAHVEEYFNMNHGNLTEFTNRFFILFSIPKTNNLLLTRLENNSSWYQNKNMPDYRPIQPESYELKDSIEFGISENTIFQLDSDLFYTVEGFDYLQGLLGKYFGINLPEICRDLHNTYISTQQIAVETFDKNTGL